MQANQKQQSDLLELGALDSEMNRTKFAIESVNKNSRADEARKRQMALASQLIDARNILDSLKLELIRAEDDLQLVEQRIAKDQVRLNQTSSSKDAQGIQAELDSLAKRKSDLEDIEIAVLEKRDEAQTAFDNLQGAKNEVDNGISAIDSDNLAEILKLQSGLDLLKEKRKQLAGMISGELLELYQRKSARGVAVGRLIHRECGACRITIGATALAEIQNLGPDEIATCPECQAILIR